MAEKWSNCYVSYNSGLKDILSGADVPQGNHATCDSGVSLKSTRKSGLKVDDKTKKLLLQKYYRHLFDEDAQSLTAQATERACLDPLSVDSNWIRKALVIKYRRFLASIVYKASYAPQHTGKGKNFCWEICGNELHAIKSDALKRRNGQSPMALLPVFSRR